MFRPFHPLFNNAHLQTIASHLWRRPESERRFPLWRRLYRTEPDVEVLVESQRPAGRARGHVVMVHGLEGAGSSGYIQSLSAALLDAGYAPHRFHMRTCGGTEALCQTLYHGGLTSDLLAVLRQMHAESGERPYLVGFSLGGNVVLKLAGELGADAPGLLQSVCTASTPIDLGVCARRIDAPENVIYQRRFVKRMRARLIATGRFKDADFEGLHTIFDIDDKITAPSFGFGTAENYYATQSAKGFLARIALPTLLIQSKDDSFIPFSVYSHPAITENPHIRLLATERGGHLGFIARGRERFWVDGAILAWLSLTR